MKNKLQSLQSAFGNFPTIPDMHPKYEEFLQNALVVLPAGGESSRFKSIKGAGSVQKSAFLLPSGETMLQRTIILYRSLGISRFLILLYHNADSIEAVLKDGSALGVSISYSFDPGRPVGRGGALKVAHESGAIKETDYCIVHNPDDQFVGDVEKIFKRIIVAHLGFEEGGTKATVVVSPGANYNYSAFVVEKGSVTDASVYPMIPIPTHTGVTIFSPTVVGSFVKLFDLSEKTDFEPVIFPKLIDEKALSAVDVPENSWIPVNDEKGLKRLLEYLN